MPADPLRATCQANDATLCTNTGLPLRVRCHQALESGVDLLQVRVGE